MVLIDPKDIWSLSKSFVLSKLLDDKVWSFIKWQVSDASRSQSLEYRSRKKYTYKWKERRNIDLRFCAFLMSCIMKSVFLVVRLYCQCIINVIIDTQFSSFVSIAVIFHLLMDKFFSCLSSLWCIPINNTSYNALLSNNARSFTIDYLIKGGKRLI